MTEIHMGSGIDSCDIVLGVCSNVYWLSIVSKKWEPTGSLLRYYVFYVVDAHGFMDYDDMINCSNISAQACYAMNVMKHETV